MSRLFASVLLAVLAAGNIARAGDAPQPMGCVGMRNAHDPHACTGISDHVVRSRGDDVLQSRRYPIDSKSPILGIFYNEPQ